MRPEDRLGLKGSPARVTEGQFEDFVGLIEELRIDEGKVLLKISYFGEETPIEVDIEQVTRI